MSKPAGQKGSTDLNMFHVLSEEEYSSYLTAYNRVYRAINQGLEIYAQESLFQFEACLNSIKKAMQEVNLGVMVGNAEFWQRPIICTALTFAAALNMHQERSLARATRLHGKDSPEWQALKELFSKEFNTCAGYRLTYVLRNVMIHHTVECVGLHLSADEERSPGGIVLGDRHIATARLMRNQFLRNDHKYVKAYIQAELSAMNEDPDLLPLFRDALASIHRVSKGGFAILNADMDHDLVRLCELDNLFGERESGRALGRFVELNEGRPRQTSIPHTVLDPQIFAYAKEMRGAF